MTTSYMCFVSFSSYIGHCLYSRVWTDVVCGLAPSVVASEPASCLWSVPVGGQLRNTGADSMGAMGRSPLWPKSCGAMPSSCPHRNFSTSFLSNNKMGQILRIWFNPSHGCTGNYEHVTCKWQKEPWFQPNNAPKVYGGRAPRPPPGTTSAAYSAPPDTVAGFKG